MAQVGAISGKITADPNGLIQGFARSKREVQQFERQFTGATRSIGGAVQNLAVDLAISGDVGTRNFKRLTDSALGFAMVLGPTGAIVGGLGLTLTSLLTFHQRAQEEADKTRQKYLDMAKAFDLSSRVEAVRLFQADPKGGKRVTEITEEIDRLNAKQNKLVDSGREWTLQFGINERKLQALGAELLKLDATHKSLLTSVVGQAQAEQRLLEATALVEAREKARLETARQLLSTEERLAQLRASGPAFRLAVSDARIAASAEQAAGTSALNAITGTTAGLQPKAVDALAESNRLAAQAAADITSEFGQLTQGVNMLKAGAVDTATALKTGLQAAVVNVAQTLTMMAGQLGAQLAGGGFFAGIGGAAGAGIGGKLLGGLIGTTFGGPLGAALGSVAGGFIGKAVGGLVRGVGKLFGFGKKKRREDEEAARRMRELAEAAKKAAEELNNVPRGIKIALARFNASDPAPQRPTGVTPPLVPPGTVPRLDASDPAPQRPTGVTPPLVPPGTVPRLGVGGQGVYIENLTVVSNDPDDFLRKMEKSGYTTKRGGVRSLSLALSPGA